MPPLPSIRTVLAQPSKGSASASVGNLPSLKQVLGTSNGQLPSLKDVLAGNDRMPAPKAKGHGFLGNLVHDAESTLANIPAGVVQTAEHPIGTAKGIAHSYAETYGPLLHGDIGKFLHGVEQHPLGPILDLATLLTAGAGAAGRVGETLGRAGVIAEDSKLARLGRAADLTAPDFAKSAGQGGEDVVLKRSSANPLIRARQQAVNKGLNKLPVNTPVLGPAARVVKALGKAPEREAARLTIMAGPFNKAFDKLSTSEKAAWHLAARAVHPAEYAAHLEAQTGPVSAAMLNILKDPKVAQLVEHPTPRLADALAKGRDLSERLTEMKVQAGHVSEQAAAEAPYRLLRLINGAKIDEHGVADVAGRDIPTLAKELAAKGHEQPFYVPDSAETGKGASVFARKPTGLAEPAKSGASKQNLGVLANRGLLAINQNPLGREFAKFRSHTEGALLHDELVKHAAALPHGEPLPRDYEYLKLNRGEASAPYTEKVAADFEHALAPGTADQMLTRDEAGDIATHPQTGERLVVPSEVRRILENKSLTYHGTLHHLLYNQPTSVWKHLVLGLRPAFFGNITIGNSILGALQMAPGRHGFAGWINQVVPGADKLLGSRLTSKTVHDVMPEQALGSFGHSTGFTSNKGLSLAHKAYQGVMPATIRYEDVLRRAMAEGWAKANPQVRAAMREHGGDINAALRQVAETHPRIIDDISKRVDDALGNYRTYNGLERKVKQLIPFYGWDRHIVRSTARLASERPGTLNALTKEGEVGQQTNDRTLGALPTFLQGAIKLPGLPGFMGSENGRTPLLDTHSLNPLHSDADLLSLLQGLVSGQAGTHSEELSSGLNPLVQALIEQITGHSLLTGGAMPKNGPAYGALGNVAYNTAVNLPQSAIIAALTGHGKKTKPTSLYQSDAQSKIAAFLGASVKKTNLQTAHRMAATQGKPPR